MNHPVKSSLTMHEHSFTPLGHRLCLSLAHTLPATRLLRPLPAPPAWLLLQRLPAAWPAGARADGGGWAGSCTSRRHNMIARNGPQRAWPAVWPSSETSSVVEREELSFLSSVCLVRTRIYHIS